jgi:hypothetical protein
MASLSQLRPYTRHNKVQHVSRKDYRLYSGVGIPSCGGFFGGIVEKKASQLFLVT